MKAGDARPFLRWAGSKRKQLHILSTFWNSDYRRYVEPFMGSACLFFALSPNRAILADTNSDLVRTFRTVRDHPTAVSNRLRASRITKRDYYRVRRQDPATLSDFDAAARFIFLNRLCFNGLYRTNNSGKFNVPCGSSATATLPTDQQLRFVAHALRFATLRDSDFGKTLAKTKRGDFVYLDPPYAVDNRRVFRQYGPSSFGRDDLRRLSCALKSADGRGVNFVLSYASCKEAREFFSHWPARRIFIQRNIAGFSADRRKAGELLISNCFPSE